MSNSAIRDVFSIVTLSAIRSTPCSGFLSVLGILISAHNDSKATVLELPSLFWVLAQRKLALIRQSRLRQQASGS